MATRRDDALYIAFNKDTTNDELILLLMDNQRSEEMLDRIHARLDELPDPPRSMRLRFWIEDVVSAIRRRLTFGLIEAAGLDDVASVTDAELVAGDAQGTIA